MNTLKNLNKLYKLHLAFLILIAMTLLITGCSAKDLQDNSNDYKLTIAVSIVPEASFIEAVAGDLVEVITIIPPGNSPANYQPTMTEMQSISDADIYFVMQVPTEEANILPKIDDFNSDLYIVNLRGKTEEEYPLRFLNGSSDESVDPHIWLSPKRAIVMVQAIADELSKADTANENLYQENAASYIKELKALDESIRSLVSGMDNKAFMIYHGAYGYFADDYGLEMISIENDGKAATPEEIIEVIDVAKDKGITSIFYQDEFDDSQAQSIAVEIGGTVVKSEPLSKDYIESLTDFANALTNYGD